MCVPLMYTGQKIFYKIWKYFVPFCVIFSYLIFFKFQSSPINIFVTLAFN